MLKEKIRKRKWRTNCRKDSIKHKKYQENGKLKKWSAKKTKQMPKWQVLDQMAEILPP